MCLELVAWAPAAAHRRGPSSAAAAAGETESAAGRAARSRGAPPSRAVARATFPHPPSGKIRQKTSDAATGDEPQNASGAASGERVALWQERTELARRKRNPC